MTREEILELIGDPEQFLRDSETFQRSMEYVSSHSEELYAQYEGKWIGVYDGEFIAHGDEQPNVLDALEAAGVPEQFALVEYVIPRDIAVMMLWR